MADTSEGENTPNIMEEYFKSLINQVLDEREIALKDADAQKIITAIIPELDKLVSDRIKEHFAILAKHIQQKFSG